MKSWHSEIRRLLLANPDGMQPKKIAEALGLHPGTIYSSLKAMPDAYVDRWEGPFRGQYAAVFCCHPIPEDCPHPKKGV